MPYNTPETPGDVLRRLLSVRHWTQEQFAKRIRTSRYSINQIVNGRRTVTAAMAVKFSRALGKDPEYWLDLQQTVDLYRVRQTTMRRHAALPNK